MTKAVDDKEDVVRVDFDRAEQDLIVTHFINGILLKFLAQQNGILARTFDSKAQLGVIGTLTGDFKIEPAFVIDLLAENIVHLCVLFVRDHMTEGIMSGHDEKVTGDIDVLVAKNKPGGGILFLHGSNRLT